MKATTHDFHCCGEAVQKTESRELQTPMSALLRRARDRDYSSGTIHHLDKTNTGEFHRGEMNNKGQAFKLADD